MEEIRGIRFRRFDLGGFYVDAECSDKGCDLYIVYGSCKDKQFVMATDKENFERIESVISSAHDRFVEAAARYLREHSLSYKHVINQILCSDSGYSIVIEVAIDEQNVNYSAKAYLVSVNNELQRKEIFSKEAPLENRTQNELMESILRKLLRATDMLDMEKILAKN